jgi:apolipoprotein N-acyltransferase
MSANAEAIVQRNMWISLLPVIICSGCAALLAATLPLTDLPWLAFPALAGLFWSWRSRTWREALLYGFLAGLIYFSLAFSWFGETAGALLGRFGFVTVLGPALLSAPFFALTALLANRAERFAAPPFVPAATAAAFALAEALRSMGPLGNPFAQIAYPQVTTPFGTLAAWIGATGVTALVAFTSASLTEYFIAPKASRLFLGSISGVLLLLLAGGLAFAARPLAAPDLPIAIVQGDIRQDLKWSRPAFDLAVARYTSLTNGIAETPSADPPKIILWPETVIPTDLAADAALQQEFARLAARARAVIIVGALERHDSAPYNTLWYFSPDGTQRVYRKRRLVPFAEWLPAEVLLSRMPFASFISRFGAGKEDAVIPAAGVKTAPLICWESGFADLLHPQLVGGAALIVIATDDAWFGRTAGPDQHAQIAQMRAIESGAWVIRAAATGVSGIIAPDGRFTERSVLDQIQVVRGSVGRRVPTLFATLGPLPIDGALAFIYIASILSGVIWRRARRGSVAEAHGWA